MKSYKLKKNAKDTGVTMKWKIRKVEGIEVFLSFFVVFFLKFFTAGFNSACFANGELQSGPQRATEPGRQPLATS